MMPVTVCFVIPQNQNKNLNNSFDDDFTVAWSCCLGNSAYLSISHDAISTNHVQVFCV